MVQDYRNVRVWAKAHELTLKIYRATKNFPENERYGIVSQIRRACASIPTNIAEGCGRGISNDLARFIDIASGSASEVDYQLLLALDLDYLNENIYADLDEQIKAIRRMLNAFNQKIRSNNKNDDSSSTKNQKPRTKN